MPPEKPRRLGRGLEALLSVSAPSAASAAANSNLTAESAGPSSALRQIPIAEIRPNPFQPRTHFDPAELTDLTRSIESS